MRSTSDVPAPDSVHDGLAVYRLGTGPPVLLMPGPHRFEQPGDGSAGPLIGGLSRLHRQVISFDPPGSGHSTRRARLGMAEMQECADEALDLCGLVGPVDVFGHSMAGLAALAYALERPSRVARLVLVGSGSGGPAYMNARGALWNRSHPGFARLAALGVLHILCPSRGPQKLMLNFIERMSLHDPRLARPEAVRPRDWLAPRVGRTDWHRVAVRLDYASRLGEVRAPTLLLCGRHDPQFPLVCSQELAAGLGDVRLVRFEHSGHYPFIEEAGPFWAAVAAFLAGRPPTSSLERFVPGGVERSTC